MNNDSHKIKPLHDDLTGNTISAQNDQNYLSPTGSESYNGDGISEVDAMKDYVTHDELKISELTTQNKIDKLDSKIDNLSLKIDQLPTKFENMILNEREYQHKQHTETIRFIIGTIVIGGLIGGASLIVSIIGLFIGR